jgi:peptidoglycan hydrolase-like protein with peptidoglycan-binding domain
MADDKAEEDQHQRSRDAEADYVTLRAGQTVGRYRIVSVLGQGGFGITYRAADIELGREVAIKEYLPAALAIRRDDATVVPRSTAAADDFVWGRDRFIAEGRTLAALHRVPGIVLVHDFLEANGTAYLVMELLAGTTLQARLQSQGAMNPAAVGRMLWTLLDGLEEVHRAGFLHRDIKPANILLDAAGKPTLIDFGASRAAVAGRSTALTAIFTPGYAAAEQMSSAAQGPWTDIYGLAATFHHAIAGKPPPNAFDRLLVDELQPLAKLAPAGFDAALLAGLDAGLAMRAADRPQSVAEWRALLRGDAGAPPQSAGARPTVADSPATVVMPSPAVPPPQAAAPPALPMGRRRSGLWIGAAVAGIAVAGAVAWLSIDRRPPPQVAAVPADRSAEEAKLAAEAQRLRDQEELARLRTEQAAREKAEQEATQRRQIEEETRRKVEAEMAERQRQAEIARQKAEAEAQAEARRQAEARAAAEKKQAEEEAARRAEAEAAAQRKTEAERKAAEVAEAALGLSAADRQRIQAALAAQGLATGASDGVFGARTREMIETWQRRTGRTPTGYLTAESQRELLRNAPAASAAAPAPAVASAAPAANVSCDGSFSSQWCRGPYEGFPGNCWNVPATIRNGAISGSWISRGSTEAQTFNGTVSPGGDVQITYHGLGQQTKVGRHFTAAMVGRVTDGVLTAAGRAGRNGRDFSIRIQCR